MEANTQTDRSEPRGPEYMRGYQAGATRAVAQMEGRIGSDGPAAHAAADIRARTEAKRSDPLVESLEANRPFQLFDTAQLSELVISLDHRLNEADQGNAYVWKTEVMELLEMLKTEYTIRGIYWK